MPLERGNNRNAIGKNIRTELAAGKPRRQAIAIALHTARDSMKGAKGKKSAASLKKIGNIHAGFGHISHIGTGSEYGPADLADAMSEITVRHGPKEKLNATKNAMPSPSHKTSRVHIPAADAKAFNVGDRVRVSLHKHSS